MTSCEPADHSSDKLELLFSSKYDERYRPQFHFSPPAKWMNDPNGMVYYDSTYHLFYQHYPDSTIWGPMHWGHAISYDLIHWKNKPVALFPDQHGYIFSGSAVVDWDNSSGFGTQDNPPMVAVYTYHDPEGEKEGRNDYQTQGIAYSLDSGRNWKPYSGNPVLKNPGIRDFRDPKVSWIKDKWIMTLAVQDHVEFYGSPDLINWKKLSEFGQEYGAHGGVWECPDLFELQSEKGESKWVLIVSINPGGPNGGSATQYFLGKFDGREFTVEQSPETVNWIDWGPDNYAGVTWSDVPDNEGRRIFLGWMSNWNYANIVPTTSWRSATTLPREIKLADQNGKLMISSVPVPQFDELRLDMIRLNAGNYGGFDLPGSLFEIDLVVNMKTAREIGVRLSNDESESVVIGFDKDEEEFYIDRSNSGEVDFHSEFAATHRAHYRIDPDAPVTMRIIVDVSSVELFAMNGKVVMTSIVFPKDGYDRFSLFSDKPLDEMEIEQAIIYPLQSIW